LYEQGLGDGLRPELRPVGINVTLVKPGYIATNIDEASLPYLDLAAQRSDADAYAEQRKDLHENWSRGIREAPIPTQSPEWSSRRSTRGGQSVATTQISTERAQF
jgi:NAD(P)-dependent dehydrogenase (short-subunit alcohol dehydrogenase family)